MAADAGGGALTSRAEWLTGYTPRLRVREQGRVVSVGDGVAWIAGLPSAGMEEVLNFDDGSRAMVFDLTERLVGAVLLNETEQLTAASSTSGRKTRSTRFCGTMLRFSNPSTMSPRAAIGKARPFSIAQRGPNS